MDPGSYNEAFALLDRIPVRALHCAPKPAVPSTRPLTHAHSCDPRCLFHAAVDQVFHALIVTQNATVIGADGTVDEDKRKALMDTLKTYATWAKHMGRAPRASAPK